MNTVLLNIASSIAFTIIKKGLTWLINSNILTEIRSTVINLLNENITNEEKRKLTVKAARDIENKLYDESKKLPTSLLDIAVSATVLEVKANLEKKNVQI